MMTTSTSSAISASIRPAVKRNSQSNNSQSNKVKLNKTSSSGSSIASQMDSSTSTSTTSTTTTTNGGSCSLKNAAIMSKQTTIKATTMREHLLFEESDNSNFRHKSILACRNVPLTFIIVCFLVIANTNSEHVGGTNVQKFHPNGRYGRSSVNNFAEPHAELGKLMLDDQLDSSLMSNDIPSASDGRGASLSDLMHRIHRDRSLAHLSSNSNSNQQQAAHKLQQLLQKRHMPSEVANRQDDAGDMFEVNGVRVANYQLEMNKLLKCNFSGLSNLYWCDPTTSASSSSSP